MRENKETKPYHIEVAQYFRRDITSKDTPLEARRKVESDYAAKRIVLGEKDRMRLTRVKAGDLMYTVPEEILFHSTLPREDDECVVTVVERMAKVVTIEAASEMEAEDTVRQMLRTGELWLSKSDVKNVRVFDEPSLIDTLKKYQEEGTRPEESATMMRHCGYRIANALAERYTMGWHDAVSSPMFRDAVRQEARYGLMLRDQLPMERCTITVTAGKEDAAWDAKRLAPAIGDFATVYSGEDGLKIDVPDRMTEDEKSKILTLIRQHASWHFTCGQLEHTYLLVNITTRDGQTVTGYMANRPDEKESVNQQRNLYRYRLMGQEIAEGQTPTDSYKDTGKLFTFHPLKMKEGETLHIDSVRLARPDRERGISFNVLSEGDRHKILLRVFEDGMAVDSTTLKGREAEDFVRQLGVEASRQERDDLRTALQWRHFSQDLDRENRRTFSR
jgi:hypothetical protein